MKNTCHFLIVLLLIFSTTTWARTFHVGPEQKLVNIGDVPWETLAAGDTVQIYYRPDPYREKWVICARGTVAQPIVVRGISGPNGEYPIIDGRNATTRKQLNYWNESRGVLKIGGANTPADTMPQNIIVENLEIRSGRPPYTFTGRHGVVAYANNAAAIFLEKGEQITIRNCILHDSGNGFFCASQSSNVLIEGCYIYDNGMEGRIYEHNNYTEARGIIFQFNHFGRLRRGCMGNNLKDRSAGTIIRYNWIEDGNRQLDLVDAGHAELFNDPVYRITCVYGNILIEGHGQGNSQMVHYGGDSNLRNRYRKGTLYFYNNTIISTRSDNTTLMRLSTGDETCLMQNNIIYIAAPGEQLALSHDAGILQMQNNWIKSGWVIGHEPLTGSVQDLGNNFSGDDPGFVNLSEQQFELIPDSPCIDMGSLPKYPVENEYIPHQQFRPRFIINEIDIGAYEAIKAP